MRKTNNKALLSLLFLFGSFASNGVHSETDLSSFLAKIAANKQVLFLTIGEDHRNSSAVIGLAHEQETLYKSKRKIVIISEDLKRLSGMLGGDKPYTKELVSKALRDTDQDIDALNALIQRGFVVFGLESQKTAPPLFIQAKTKEQLAKQSLSQLPYLRNIPGFNEALQRKLADANETVETLRDFLNQQYALTNERVSTVNEEIFAQMMKAQKDFPGALVIFAGGAAHIPAARDKNSNPIHQGVLAELRSKAGSEKAVAAFFNSNPPKDASHTYTPNDPKLLLGAIPNYFVTPIEYSTPGTPLDKFNAKYRKKVP